MANGNSVSSVKYWALGLIVGAALFFAPKLQGQAITNLVRDASHEQNWAGWVQYNENGNHWADRHDDDYHYDGFHSGGMHASNLSLLLSANSGQNSVLPSPALPSNGVELLAHGDRWHTTLYQYLEIPTRVFDIENLEVQRLLSNLQNNGYVENVFVKDEFGRQLIYYSRNPNVEQPQNTDSTYWIERSRPNIGNWSLLTGNISDDWPSAWGNPLITQFGYNLQTLEWFGNYYGSNYYCDATDLEGLVTRDIEALQVAVTEPYMENQTVGMQTRYRNNGNDAFNIPVEMIVVHTPTGDTLYNNIQMIPFMFSSQTLWQNFANYTWTRTGQHEILGIANYPLDEIPQNDTARVWINVQLDTTTTPVHDWASLGITAPDSLILGDTLDQIGTVGNLGDFNEADQVAYNVYDNNGNNVNTKFRNWASIPGQIDNLDFGDYVPQDTGWFRLEEITLLDDDVPVNDTFSTMLHVVRKPYVDLMALSLTGIPDSLQADSTVFPIGSHYLDASSTNPFSTSSVLRIKQITTGADAYASQVLMPWISPDETRNIVHSALSLSQNGFYEALLYHPDLDSLTSNDTLRDTFYVYDGSGAVNDSPVDKIRFDITPSIGGVFKFSYNVQQPITFNVYGADGRYIQSLGPFNGYGIFNWDANVSSGVYFLKDDKSVFNTRKITVLK